MNTDFYSNVVAKLNINHEDSVLVVCGGSYDKETMLQYGLKKVTISNLAHHDNVEDYSPFPWEYQDVENLTYDDCSFDWVVVHAGLHHAASPHYALCEMLRVCRKGILVIEARDSLLMKAAHLFGLIPDYETEPLVLSEGKEGGLRNTNIPNYIYRWTEREVEKTVNSYLPQFSHKFEYFYAYRLPIQRMTMSNNQAKRIFVNLMAKIIWPIEKILPRQGNCFAFKVSKEGPLRPWLKKSDDKLEFDMEYGLKVYEPNMYKK
jgi:ubiquinone/menaquinone biosynthesis C-methylase UbiE